MPGDWGIWGRVELDPPLRTDPWESPWSRRARRVVVGASFLTLLPLNYWAIASFDAIWAVARLDAVSGAPALGPGGWWWVVVILGFNLLPVLTIEAALFWGGFEGPAGDVAPIVLAALQAVLVVVVRGGSLDASLRLDALSATDAGGAREALAVYLTLTVVALAASLVRLAVDWAGRGRSG